MIIDLILPHAGMGNQMFMYVAGLALSQRLNTELVLDTWGFNEPDVRGDFLDKFPNITERRARLSEIWKFSKGQAIVDYLGIRGHSIKKHPFRRLLYELISRTGMLKNDKIYSDCDLAKIPDNVYLTGWWSSEKYLVGIEELVREKFKFSSNCFNPKLSEKIKACNSVAVHVRRGDKVTRKDFLASDDNYTRHAIEKISGLTSDIKFFVFSDDIAWCRENLPQIYEADYTFIEGQTAQQDMALMTICKHVIMGPSTFSWWGAWLNENPKKIIIAPDLDLWLPGQTVNADLLPTDWIRCD
ncbi:MAG: alpha-1,2-fucosyltransferase [Synergistaceae bacterium]|nr:alpha-1,2-fucosyltransferase [Synergistaceae bacterium]